MIYNRGTKGSYDLWAQLVGDESYSWDDMLPHFKRSIHFTPPNVSVRGANSSAIYDVSAFSPDGGPLQVSYPNYAMPFGAYGLPALQAIGFPNATGFADGTLDGVTHNVSNTLSGEKTNIILTGLRHSRSTPSTICGRPPRPLSWITRSLQAYR